MSDEEPFRPKYRGFDEAATKRAQETAEHAQKTRAAPGEDANADYVDQGPTEAGKRTGRTREEVEDAVERAAKRGRAE